MFNQRNSLPVFDVRRDSTIKLAATSSQGNQDKWYQSGYFIKAPLVHDGLYWKDYKAEVAAYQIGSQLGLNVVKYAECLIRYRHSVLNGCFSKDFRNSVYAEEFVSISKLTRGVQFFSTAHEKYCGLIEFLVSQMGMNRNDVVFSIESMLILDYIILNEDRHWGNFGVLRGNYGVKMAPIFDNGISMLSWGFNKSLSKVRSRTFSSSFDEQVSLVRPRKLSSKLSLYGVDFPSFTAKRVVERQYMKLKKLWHQ